MPEAFNGFPPEGFAFFKKLHSNNNRDWFQAHKEIYERACREPMKALVAEINRAGAKPHISRINRDMRFIRDRAPYRTHIAAGVGSHWLSLSADGLYIGSGVYKPEPPMLEKLRGAIDSDTSGLALTKILATLRKKGYTVDTHERVPSTPRGYSADHARIDLLRMKDIHAGRMFEKAPWLSTRNTIDRIKRAMTDLEPFNEWLNRYVR